MRPAADVRKSAANMLIASDNGINKIDTAPQYSNSHKYISNIKKLSTFKITTKLGNINCNLNEIQKTIEQQINEILKKKFYKKNRYTFNS